MMCEKVQKLFTKNVPIQAKISSEEMEMLDNGYAIKQANGYKFYFPISWWNDAVLEWYHEKQYNEKNGMEMDFHFQDDYNYEVDSKSNIEWQQLINLSLKQNRKSS